MGQQTQNKRAQFQSTLPFRGATTVGFLFLGGCIDFNPRSPYGERQLKQLI